MLSIRKRARERFVFTETEWPSISAQTTRQAEENADETGSESEATPCESAPSPSDLTWQRKYNSCVEEIHVRAETPVPSADVARQKASVCAEVLRFARRQEKGSFCLRCLGWPNKAGWQRHVRHSPSPL